MRFHRLGLAEALNVGAAPPIAGAPMPIVDAAKPIVDAAKPTSIS